MHLFRRLPMPPGLFDFNPPVVETLSISPTVLNVQQEEQYVTVICRVSDDFSGVAKVEVELSGRMGSDQASVSRSDTSAEVVSSATSPTGCYWDTTTTPDSLKINTLTTSTVACTPKYKCICAPTPVKQKELLDENLMDKQQGRIV